MAQPYKDSLAAELARFEALVDSSDPQQAALLEEMREHTRRLRQARGDWNAPSTHRNWNSAKLPEKARPPLEDASYRRARSRDAALPSSSRLGAASAAFASLLPRALEGSSAHLLPTLFPAARATTRRCLLPQGVQGAPPAQQAAQRDAAADGSAAAAAGRRELKGTGAGSAARWAGGGAAGARPARQLARVAPACCL